MNPAQKQPAKLRGAIGEQVLYNGVNCTVVELLEQPLCLVLQALGARTAIQDSQFGSPYRRVTPVYTIPCLNDEGDGGLHSELLALGLSLEL